MTDLLADLNGVQSDLERLRAHLGPEGLTALERFVVFDGFEGDGRGFPSFWTRKTPRKDDPAGNHIILLGVSVAMPPGNPEAAEPALNVQSATFGAVPEGWSSATEQLPPSELTDHYRLMTAPEREALAELGAADAEIADCAIEGGHPKYPDGSPWAYVPPVQRRTPSGTARKAEERAAFLERKREELQRQLGALDGDDA